MIFRLQDLLESPCPNLWHALISAGVWRNSQVEVHDTLAIPLLKACNEPPPSVAVDAPSMFTARLRTEAEKAPLRLVCADCSSNVAGRCEGSSCCGGHVPIEVRLNLTSTNCPQGRWPAI